MFMTRVPEIRGHDRAIGAIVLGVFVYATGPVIIQSSSVSGPVLSFWRLWLGVGMFAVIVVFSRDSRADWLVFRRWSITAWAGLAFAANQLAFFTAVKFTSVADVALLATLGPVVTAIGAAYMFAERPGARYYPWAAIAIAGGMVVAVSGGTGPSGNPLGMALAGAAVITFSLFALLSKLARDRLPVHHFLAGTTLVAALAVSAYVFVANEPVMSLSGQDFALAGSLALGPGVLGHLLMTWPLRWIAANVSAVMRLATPVAATALAWLILDEPITVPHVVGGAVIIGGACGAVLAYGHSDLPVRLSRAERPAEGSATRKGESRT